MKIYSKCKGEQVLNQGCSSFFILSYFPFLLYIVAIIIDRKSHVDKGNQCQIRIQESNLYCKSLLQRNCNVCVFWFFFIVVGVVKSSAIIAILPYLLYWVTGKVLPVFYTTVFIFISWSGWISISATSIVIKY